MGASNQVKFDAATGVANAISKVSAHSGDPGTTGASEITGGSPAYARMSPPTFTVTATGTFTFQVTFDVGTGSTVAGIGTWDSLGNFLFGYPVPTTGAYTAQGKYVATVNYQYQQA